MRGHGACVQAYRLTLSNYGLLAYINNMFSVTITKGFNRANTGITIH